MPAHPASYTLYEINQARHLIEFYRNDAFYRQILAKWMALTGLSIWLTALHMVRMDRFERIEAARQLEEIRHEFPSRRARLMLRVAQLNFPTYH